MISAETAKMILTLEPAIWVGALALVQIVTEITAIKK